MIQVQGMCCRPIYSGRQVCGRTSRGHTGGKSHRISHPPSFCGACLNFFSREGFSRSFPSSTVKSNFVYNVLTIHSNVLNLLGIFFNSFVRKNTSSCDDTEIRTHVPTSEGFEFTN